MKTLAHVALDHLLLLLFGVQDQIDPDYQSSAVAEIPAILLALTREEREALSQAASERLSRVRAMFPDAIRQGDSMDATEGDFLDSLASGEVFSNLVT